MSSSRSPYPPDLKAEAVRLARNSGRPVTQTAKDLGVSPESLRRWIKQAELDPDERPDNHTARDLGQLRALRAESRRLESTTWENRTTVLRVISLILACVLWLLTVVFAVGQVLLIFVNNYNAWTITSAYSTSTPDRWVIVQAFLVIATGLALSTAGVFVAIGAEAPANRLGWLMLLASIIYSGIHVSGEYATYAVRIRHDALSLGHAAASPWEWAWQPFMLVLLFVFILFPTGRPVHGRWTAASLGVGVLLIVQAVVLMILPGPIDELKVDNPLGVSHLPGWFSWVGFNVADNRALLVLPVLVGILALIHRVLRSQGDERQQLKWVAYGAFVGLMLLIVATLTGHWAVAFLGLALLPIFTTIGILWWRLIDIDRLIDLTAVYGPVWAIISVLNAGLIYSVEEMSAHLPVAGALCAFIDVFVFEPLRSRIDGLVERWFRRPQREAAVAR